MYNIESHNFIHRVWIKDYRSMHGRDVIEIHMEFANDKLFDNIFYTTLVFRFAVVNNKLGYDLYYGNRDKPFEIRIK